MSVWSLIFVGMAIGGAFLLWHSVSRTKHASEQMLKTYSEMLAEARNKRRAQLTQQRLAEAAENTQATD